MRAVILVIGIGWVVFWLGWLVAAFTAKSSRGGGGRFAAGRIVLVLAVGYLLRSDLTGRPGPHLVAGPVLAGLGLALWAAGLGLAVWARVYIGRNWGMPMTRREQPDLVTTGPYRFIRHPIYTGVIAAMFGTALATTPYALIAVAILTAYFVFSAYREETFLAREFPDAYPAYRARSKMLIPFLF
jgi:protein-S-isoprenylcysteine O-methyltransferase Ste14